MKILCAFGKYQYGEPSRGLSPEYASFIPAIERLGHTIYHFELWNRKCYSSYAELNKALLQTIENVNPDVMLAVPLNYEIWMETLQIIRSQTKVATICWTTDDSWKYLEVSRFIGHGFHAITTTYADAFKKYHKDNIDNVLLTQWAANSVTLRKPLPAAECRYPVSFIGSAHGNRKRRVNQLRKHGIDVACFGFGWPEGPIASSQLYDIIRSSIISLNFANSRGQNQIKARTFEVPGAGGFLLTEFAPGLDKCFIIGKEIEMFEGMKDLVKKIYYYLENPGKRDSIAQASYSRTAKEHTYDIRMKEVIDFAIKSRDKYLGKRKDEPIVTIESAIEKHRITAPLKLLRKVLIILFTPIWGNKRGNRAARRLVYEISWRLFKSKTYTASGWPGIMFPDQ